MGHPDWGKAVNCPDCTDFLPLSGLKPHEQKLKLLDIQELHPVHMLLRVLGRQILDDPYGWLTLYGEPFGGEDTATGTAKSLFARALVAEFCRRRVRALYKHAGDLADMLYSDMHQDSSANEALLRRCPVLVVDEMQDINPTEWLVGKFKALLDLRHRGVDEGQITILVWQRNPETYGWVPESWLSRMKDGRFNRRWPDDVNPPALDLLTTNQFGVWIPGFLPISAPDVRPYQVRRIVQDPPQVPHVGKREGRLRQQAAND